MDILELVTVIVVTSPSPCHPATSLLESTIESLALIKPLDSCHLVIVADGYRVNSENINRTKKGRVGEDLRDRYEQYLIAVENKICNSNSNGTTTSHRRLLRCEDHHGFAHAVKIGLEACTTKYALVAQHDRAFFQGLQSGGLELLLRTMEEDETVRYIGFPSSSNYLWDRLMISQGVPRLADILNKPPGRIYLSDSMLLQPLTFWFDSQHLCHVERYLNIFRPFKTMPVHLQQLVGVKTVKEMVLRKGDFIEDRFGQQQRRILHSLASSASPVSVCIGVSSGETTKISDELILEMFRWFGSYLVYDYSGESSGGSSSSSNGSELTHPALVEEEQEEEQETENLSGGHSSITQRDDNEIPSIDHASHHPKTMIYHLKGRTYDPEKVESRLKEAAPISTKAATWLLAAKHNDVTRKGFVISGSGSERGGGGGGSSSSNDSINSRSGKSEKDIGPLIAEVDPLFCVFAATEAVATTTATIVTSEHTV